MKKFWFTFAVAVLAIATATPVRANSHGHGSAPRAAGASRPAYHAAARSRGSYANYHVRYGTRFAHGYYYAGRSHYHWTSQRWDARYGCTCYFDPGCASWYYWCEPASCYYPVTYCPYRTYSWQTPGVAVVRAPVDVPPGPTNGPPVQTNVQPIPAPVAGSSPGTAPVAPYFPLPLATESSTSATTAPAADE